MEYFLGGIMIFGGNYPPRYWLCCEGQLQSINENPSLYSLLGTMYGGDGRTNFGIPDLRSRVPTGMGRGIGLSPIFQGHMYGSEINSLHISQMPQHTHDATFIGTGGGAGSPITASASAKMFVFDGIGDQASPSGNYIAQVKSGMSGAPAYNSTKSTNTLASDAIEVDVTVTGGGGGITGGTVSVDNTGDSQPFGIIQPSLGMNYIIAVQGIYPARS